MKRKREDNSATQEENNDYEQSKRKISLSHVYDLLCNAVVKNDENLVKAILDQNSEIDVNHIYLTYENKKFTLLHLAARYNCKKIAKLLLAKGADTSIGNSSNWTPLHEAVLNNNSELINLLLNYEIEITNIFRTIHDKKFTSLEISIIHSHIASLKSLLLKGVIINDSMLVNSIVNADILKLIESAYFIQKLFEKDFVTNIDKNLSSFLQQKFDAEDLNFCREYFDKMLLINITKSLRKGDSILNLIRIIAENIKQAESFKLQCANNKTSEKSLAEFVCEGSKFYPVPSLKYMAMNAISTNNKNASIDQNQKSKQISQEQISSSCPAELAELAIENIFFMPVEDSMSLDNNSTELQGNVSPNLNQEQ